MSVTVEKILEIAENLPEEDFRVVATGIRRIEAKKESAAIGEKEGATNERRSKSRASYIPTSLPPSPQTPEQIQKNKEALKGLLEIAGITAGYDSFEFDKGDGTTGKW